MQNIPTNQAKLLKRGGFDGRIYLVEVKEDWAAPDYSELARRFEEVDGWGDYGLLDEVLHFEVGCERSVACSLGNGIARGGYQNTDGRP